MRGFTERGQLKTLPLQGLGVKSEILKEIIKFGDTSNST